MGTKASDQSRTPVRENEQSQSANDDYFLIIVRRRRMWSWEIQRRSKPLGARFDGDDFDTPSAAKRAGEEALKGFLDALRVEQSSRP
jgi:hypothetical protein